MFFKVFNETGNYRDVVTKEERNLISAEIVFCPDFTDCTQDGWLEFETLSQALNYFNLELIPEG